VLSFSYGSHLDPDLMKARCPEHHVVGMAALHEYRLVFPLYSQDWGGGVASVQPHHGDMVWGIVFDLNGPDLASLDADQGYRGPGDQHNVYDRELLTVELIRPDDASVPRRLRAYVYVARPSNPSPPTTPYLEIVVRGARHHRLPDDYVAALGATPTRPLDSGSASVPPSV